MRGKYLLYCAILLSFRHVLCITEEYDVDQYCPLVSDGTKLPSFVSCGTYYICVKGKAVEQKCAAYQYFDKNAQSCKAAYLVRCDVEEGGNSCVGMKGGFIPTADSCRDWIACNDGVEISRGTCSEDQIFSGGRCHQGLCKPYDESEFNYHTVCRIMPENMYFGSDADCGFWNVCINNQFLNGHCEALHVFDLSVGKCNYVQNTDCSRVKEEPLFPSYCYSNGANKPHSRKCSSYHLCLYGYWRTMQCPAGQYLDIVQSTCRSRQLARTIATCDRCEGSRKPLVNAVDSNCQRYYTCDQGISTGIRICPAYSYFDEAARGCFEVADGNLVDYKQLNGACNPAKNNNQPKATLTNRNSYANLNK